MIRALPYLVDDRLKKWGKYKGFSRGWGKVSRWVYPFQV
ncbi:hypothetical protein [Pasteuria penetrans]